jgi:hypothetical protein
MCSPLKINVSGTITVVKSWYLNKLKFNNLSKSAKKIRSWKTENYRRYTEKIKLTFPSFFRKALEELLCLLAGTVL